MSDAPPLLSLPIECARVRLRRFRVDDIDAFADYRSLEQVNRYQTWPRPYTREHARELIADVSGGLLLRAGGWTQVAIAERDSDGLIGDIGTRSSAAAPWVYELGFTIAPEHQRQGLALEAVGAWVQALCGPGQAQAITAVTDRRNLASQALLRRLAFEFRYSKAAAYFGEPCIDEHFELLTRSQPATSA